MYLCAPFTLGLSAGGVWPEGSTVNVVSILGRAYYFFSENPVLDWKDAIDHLGGFDRVSGCAIGGGFIC